MNLNIEELKFKSRKFGLSGELILNNAKYMGVNDWSYDFVTLDDREEIANTKDITFYFVSGSDTLRHKVNAVLLNQNPSLVIGDFHREINNG